MTKNITEFTPSAALAELIAEVQTMTRWHTKFDWGMAIVNVPLFLVTYGLITLDTDDTSTLKSVAMPDSWLIKALNFRLPHHRRLSD